MTAAQQDSGPGRLVRVTGLRAGLEEGEVRRLHELGFHEGAVVRLLRRVPFGGPSIFEVSGTVFSLEARLVSHVDVTAL
jgi:Fe2+ transport system protein FeoA